MRLLVDEHALGWDEAWAVTRATFAYTNHTLLPEALEKWTVDLFGSLLSRLSLIDENGPRYLRMAHLACVGSHTINGVAQLHSDLLKQTVLRDFAELWPAKFCNVTNGVTPRRFVAVSNPSLTQLVTARIGDGWPQDPHQLRALEPLADDPEFQRQWRDVKLANKRRLGALITERTGIAVVPESLFDVMVKRIHEYKRQHLNALHILTHYLRLKRDPQADVPTALSSSAARPRPAISWPSASSSLSPPPATW
jgi:starch phosphorylase